METWNTWAGLQPDDFQSEEEVVCMVLPRRDTGQLRAFSRKVR